MRDVTGLKDITASPAELLEPGEAARERLSGVQEVVEATEGPDGRQPRRFLLWVTDRRLLFLYVDRQAEPPRIATVSVPYAQLAGVAAERGGSFLVLGLAAASVALGLAAAALDSLLAGILGIGLFLVGAFGILQVLFPPYRFTLSLTDGARLSVVVPGRHVRALQATLSEVTRLGASS